LEGGGEEIAFAAFNSFYYVETKKMSSDFDLDDFARLLALEHAFGALTLISAGNFAYLAEVKPSEAIRQFRSAIESSIYDSADTPADVRVLMRKHLKRMFDHIAQMAEHADKGSP
jgi:hypothetical protein